MQITDENCVQVLTQAGGTYKQYTYHTELVAHSGQLVTGHRELSSLEEIQLIFVASAT